LASYRDLKLHGETIVSSLHLPHGPYIDKLGVVIMDFGEFRARKGHDVQKEHYFGSQSQRTGTLQTETNLS
jgi:hypothetical protein